MARRRQRRSARPETARAACKHACEGRRAPVVTRVSAPRTTPPSYTQATIVVPVCGEPPSPRSSQGSCMSRRAFVVARERHLPMHAVQWLLLLLRRWSAGSTSVRARVAARLAGRRGRTPLAPSARAEVSRVARLCVFARKRHRQARERQAARAQSAVLRTGGTVVGSEQEPSWSESMDGRQANQLLHRSAFAARAPRWRVPREQLRRRAAKRCRRCFTGANAPPQPALVPRRDKLSDATRCAASLAPVAPHLRRSQDRKPRPVLRARRH